MPVPIPPLFPVPLALAFVVSACAEREEGGRAQDTHATHDHQDHGDGPRHYVRFDHAGTPSYGMLDMEETTIIRIDGDLFGEHHMTDEHFDLAAVQLLPPSNPSKVIAVGLNYLSHLGGREPSTEPGLFAKYPSSLVGVGGTIMIPPGASDVHYEGEMVLVIGSTCSNISPDRALDCVFGVTVGNDVSERAWQSTDLQWLRAKGSDTFGPVGPSIAVGLDPDDLLLQTRVNGETLQSERTSDLIFDVSTIVSYISRYITLEPGDLIFTGTPGSTSALNPGDVVEVELEGVGILTNTVEAR